MKKKIIILCGPTGVGKTEISIKLAEKLDGEIVVADSQAILRGFDIGTAKPTKEEQKRIPHHLIDAAEYGECFDAAKFGKLADQAIQEIFNRGKQPIISGGTGLYLKALLYGLMDAPKRDDKFRKELEKKIEREGLEKFYKKLKKIDSKRANEIHPNDSVRIIRALELYHLTGRTPSDLADDHQFQKKKYEVLKIGLDRPRKELYERIDQRVLKMVQASWVEEVRGLISTSVIPAKAGIPLDQGGSRLRGSDIILQPIGYSLLAKHLNGELTLDEAIQQIQKETRNLAKRQLSWFRADKEIQWFHPEDWKKILRFSKEFLFIEKN